MGNERLALPRLPCPWDPRNVVFFPSHLLLLAPLLHFTHVLPSPTSRNSPSPRPSHLHPLNCIAGNTDPATCLSPPYVFTSTSPTLLTNLHPLEGKEHLLSLSLSLSHVLSLVDDFSWGFLLIMRNSHWILSLGFDFFFFTSREGGGFFCG